MKKKISMANSLTLFRIVLIIPFIIFLALGMSYIAAILFVIACISDFADGYIARKRNESTSLGAMLDPLADKLLVSAALIFLIGRGVDAWMAFVIIAREFLIMGLRSLESMSNSSNGMPAKISGKIKTFAQMIAILAVILAIPYAYYIMLLATIITIYSGIEYLIAERKLLSQHL